MIYKLWSVQFEQKKAQIAQIYDDYLTNLLKTMIQYGIIIFFVKELNSISDSIVVKEAIGWLFARSSKEFIW